MADDGDIKYLGVFCPLQFMVVDKDGGKSIRNKQCNSACAWFCHGLGSCVMHGINANLKGLQKGKRR